MAPSTSPSVPTLPPSVEEAYRRKCVFLKQRMADVEEANDAVRVRLARLKRQVEKQRLERAFLLEQLAKRTSTNVEDSDGSPSPPATPKDKPLRTKRGHRKASIADGSGPGSTFISQNLDPLSPSSDVFSKGDSQTQPTQSTPAASQRRGGRKSKAAKEAEEAANGKDGDNDNDNDKEEDGKVKRPGNAFELYCEETRPTLVEKRKANKKSKKSGGGEDGDDVDMEDADAEEEEEDEATVESSIDAELARGWTEMEQGEKDEFEARAAEEQAKYKKAKEEARQQKQKEKEEKEKEKEEKEAEEDAEAKDKVDDKPAADDDKADKEADKDAAEKEAADEEKADKDAAKDTDEKAEDKEAEPATKEATPAKEAEDTEMADPDSVAVATSDDKDE